MAGTSQQDPRSPGDTEAESGWKWDEGFGAGGDDDLATFQPPPGLEFAGFGVRAGARIIDMLLYNVMAFATALFVGVFVAIVAAAASIPVDPLMKRIGESGFIGYTFAILASIAYHTFCEGVHGSTVGKIVLGLRVIGEEDRPCSVWSAFIRELGFFVDGLFFALPAWASMKDSPERRRIGDKWAHTRVVRRRSLRPDQRRSPLRLVAGLVAGGFAYSVLFTIGLLLKLWLT